MTFNKYKMMRRLSFCLFALLLSFTSCGDAEYEYSGFSCYFIFDNTASRSALLATAMNQLSPGIFCHITVSGNYFNFETNASNQTETVAKNAIDQNRTIELGIYNNTGIIVGFGNLNNPATFYAYDSQCPNCYKSTFLPRYSLSMDSSGKAKCSKCQRVYDMNNDGIVASGEAGDKMIRYRASTTGSFGVLSVVNGQ